MQKKTLKSVIDIYFVGFFSTLMFSRNKWGLKRVMQMYYMGDNMENGIIYSESRISLYQALGLS